MSLERLSACFGVPRDAIWRHMKALDPDYRAALVAGVPLEEMAKRAAEEGLSLLDQLAVLRQGLMHSAIAAKAAGAHHAHANLSRVALQAVEASGRLSGELRNAPTITTITNNVAVLMASPLMQRLQKMLLDHLAPYPEALRAVMEILDELQGGPTSDS